MTSYQLSQDGIRRLQRRLTRFFVIVTVSSLALMVWLVTAMLFRLGMLEEFWYVPLVMVPFIIAISAVTVYRTVAMMKIRWQSFRIEVGDNQIAIHQGAGSQLSVRREEIARVEETARALVVSTANTPAAVAVPVEIGDDAYQEVRVLLSRWVPIEPQPEEVRLRRMALVSLQVVALLIIFLCLSRQLTLAAFLVFAAMQLSSWWSRRRQGYPTKLAAKYVLLTALMTAMKFSPYAGHYNALVRSLFFR